MLKDSLIKYFISEARLGSYEDLEEYSQNLIFSKNTYIPLSILEIALRNGVDKLLSDKVGVDWYEDKDFLTEDSKKKIYGAIKYLTKKREAVTKEKIIAELSFGFWVNLLKKPYDKKLRINDLKKIFLNLPSREVKMVNREVLYRELNHIRNFRNRVFHYEKVLNKDGYNQINENIFEVLNYLHVDLFEYAKRLNNE